MALMDVLNPHLQLDNDERKILKKEIDESMVLFTIYGMSVDEFTKQFLLYPAADTSMTANITVKKVFKDIFLPSTRPVFNIYTRVLKNINIEKIRKKYPVSIPISELKNIIYSDSAEFCDIEIDAGLQLNLHVHQQPSFNIIANEEDEVSELSIDEDDRYAFIELKTFIAPLEERDRSLNKYLRPDELRKSFKYRQLFGLISFSFIFNEDMAKKNTTSKKNDITNSDLTYNNDNIVLTESNIDPTKYVPISESDKVFCNKETERYIWAIHLVLMDYSVLLKAKTTRGRPKSKSKKLWNKNNNIRKNHSKNVVKNEKENKNTQIEEEITTKMRSHAILKAIYEHHKIILKILKYPKGYKFGLINNMLKVIKLLQEIKSLKNLVEHLKHEKEKAEEEKQRAEEEKQIVMEKYKEAEKKIKELENKLKEIKNK
ncbi:MAG: hypothetical protein ACTSRZ_01080 [Promethearchaeota archaeon]